VAQANVKLTVDGSQATRALKNVQGQTTKLNAGVNRLKTAIGGIGFTLLARQAVNASANFEKLKVRLGLLTKENGSFAKSLQIAKDAQKAFGLSTIEALEGVTDITARLAPLGTGVEDIKTVFFGFNTAAKLAGASAMESSNAFRQLAQALGSGRLAGDEFRSVSEQVPTVLAPIAAELGVTIGELKKFAAEGKLTSDVVLRALGRVGTEGSGFLQELLKNDPTQVFKNFTNATEDLSIAFGTELRPAVEGVTRVLTKLIISITEFVESDAGKASLAIAAIAVSVKGVAVASGLAVTALASLISNLIATSVNSAIAATGMKGLGAASLVAAGGITKATIALQAFKIALAKTGIGLAVIGVGALATAIIKAKREQKEFNDIIKEGGSEEVNKLLDQQNEALKKIEKRFETAKGRSEKALERRKKEIQEDIKALENRNKTLKTEKEITEETKRQNEEKKKGTEEIKKQQEATDKLKEKMTAVGEEIERSIKDNLREAITGAQSFGQAMTNVLNRIRDKIIDAQLDRLIGQFGENFGKSASKKGSGKGIGGFVGNILGGLFGRRANGGPVAAGKSFVVGEKGPEILTMGSSRGFVTANEKIGGGSVSNMVTVNVDASGSSVSGNNADAQALGAAIGAAVQAQLIKEKRPGGILTR